MIRNVRIHLDGTLPVMADLPALPGPADLSLLCTNMRTTDGKRPTYIERGDSWFLIPLVTVRFVEMPADALEPAPEAPVSATDMTIHLPSPTPPAIEDELDFEPDESLLQRIRDI